MPAPKPSDFITTQDFITQTIIPGQRRRWEMAYAEAQNLAKTELDKIALRQTLFKEAQAQAVAYEKMIIDLEQSHAKAIQDGTLDAWQAQQKKDVAEFNNATKIKLSNASSINAAERAYAGDRSTASRSTATSSNIANSKADRAEFNKEMGPLQIQWDAKVRQANETSAGQQIDSAIDEIIAGSDNPDLHVERAAQLRNVVRHMQDTLPSGQMIGDEAIIENIYSKTKNDPEARSELLSIVKEAILKASDAKGDMESGLQVNKLEPKTSLKSRLDTFDELVKVKESLIYQPGASTSPKAVTEGTSYKAPVRTVGVSELPDRLELDPSSQAMLDSLTPDEQLLQERLGQLRGLASEGTEEANLQLQAMRDFLNKPTPNSIDTARDIYHTRFGSQKARPVLLNDQLRRLTPGDIAELKQLAIERLAQIEAEKTSTNVADIPVEIPPINAGSPAKISPSGFMSTPQNTKDFVPEESTPYFDKPSAKQTVNPTQQLSRKEKLDKISQEKGIQKPIRVPTTIERGVQERPPIIKPGTPLPRSNKAVMEQTSNEQILLSMNKGKELAAKPSKLQRLIIQDPLARNVAMAYSIDARNQVPIKEQVDRVITTYHGSPEKQSKALEYLFASRELDKSKTFIQPKI